MMNLTETATATRPRPPHSAPNLSLTELSRRSGLTVRVLKYYEEVGLIDPPRPVGNSRIYLGVDLDKIGTIARFRSAGVDFSDIATAYAAGDPEQVRAALLALTRRSLDRLATEQRSLTGLLNTLQA